MTSKGRNIQEIHVCCSFLIPKIELYSQDLMCACCRAKKDVGWLVCVCYFNSYRSKKSKRNRFVRKPLSPIVTISVTIISWKQSKNSEFIIYMHAKTKERDTCQSKQIGWQNERVWKLTLTANSCFFLLRISPGLWTREDRQSNSRKAVICCGHAFKSIEGCYAFRLNFTISILQW